MHKAKTSRVSLNKLSDHGLKSVVSPVLFYCKSKFRLKKKRSKISTNNSIRTLSSFNVFWRGYACLKFV